jgi:hypothetical protein
MIKYFCDKCGVVANGLNKFTYLCHINDIVSDKFAAGYSDNDGNMVSGRTVTAELCNRCYNDVLVPAVKKLKEKP